MKTIDPISIWDNGVSKQATVLNAYSSQVVLGKSATFYYSLHSQDEIGAVNAMIAQGNLDMTGEEYQAWTEDNYAWDWVAAKLNLAITGDYVQPVPEQPEVIEPERPVPVVDEVIEPVETTEETSSE